jgi:hypothetical protein
MRGCVLCADMNLPWFVHFSIDKHWAVPGSVNVPKGDFCSLHPSTAFGWAPRSEAARLAGDTSALSYKCDKYPLVVKTTTCSNEHPSSSPTPFHLEGRHSMGSVPHHRLLSRYPVCVPVRMREGWGLLTPWALRRFVWPRNRGAWFG